MRPRLSLLAFLLCGGLISSCVRNGDDDVDIEPYVVNGIADMEIKKGQPGGGGASLTLEVKYMSAVQEYVTLSVEDVPPGVSYIMTPSAGYPTFVTNLVLLDSNAVPGNYVLKLRSKGTESPEKIYNINLAVLPEPDCIEGMMGNFNVNTTCFSNQAVNIVRKSPGSNTVVVRDIAMVGNRLEMIVDCKASPGVMVPKQTISYLGDMLEVQGSGNFQYSWWTNQVSSMTVVAEVKNLSTGITVNCHFQLFR